MNFVSYHQVLGMQRFGQHITTYTALFAICKTKNDIAYNVLTISGH